MKRLFASAAVAVIAAYALFGVISHRASTRAADENTQTLLLDRTHLLVSEGEDDTHTQLLERLREDDPRAQLLELLNAKVELMSDEEVEQAIHSTNSEVRAMLAKHRLDQAAASLQAIAKEFDGTPSAQLAREMLAVQERGPSSGPAVQNAPFYSPDPLQAQ